MEKYAKTEGVKKSAKLFGEGAVEQWTSKEVEQI